MKKLLQITCLILLVAGCGKLPETVWPGRGVEKEVGPMVKVYPSEGEARMDRHGLWRGMEGDRVVWEVRYTRGNPTGPYREWNKDGEMVATWPYNWNGDIEGWARWFTGGEPDGKIELTPDIQPDFEVIGHAADFKIWMIEQSRRD